MKDKTKRCLKIVAEVATAVVVPGGPLLVAVGRSEKGSAMLNSGYDAARKCYTKARNYLPRFKKPSALEQI